MEAAKDPFKALELVETSPQAAELSGETLKVIAATIAAKKKKRAGEELPVVGPAWYELERLIPFRDAVFVVGFGLVVAGIDLWSLPGALVAAGAGLMYLGWLMSK